MKFNFAWQMRGSIDISAAVALYGNTANACFAPSNPNTTSIVSVKALRNFISLILFSC
ncbi:hypothetical protein NTGBS_470032 [Candidatus Nitrotoga sp. BS]|nr:hypothetical protein NTGBS_470032 [Candidatus Nitrotoga sp. BS]